MHDRFGFPLGTVTTVVVSPFLFRPKIRFVIRREALNLVLGQVNPVVALVVHRGPERFRRHDELVAGQPPSGINYDVIDVARGVVENDIGDLAQLRIAESIKLRAAYIRGLVSVIETIISERTVMRHDFLLEY